VRGLLAREGGEEDEGQQTWNCNERGGAAKRRCAVNVEVQRTWTKGLRLVAAHCPVMVVPTSLLTSLHQLYSGRPTELNGRLSEFCAVILSARDIRDTMSAARASIDALVLQISHVLCGAVLHHPVGGPCATVVATASAAATTPLAIVREPAGDVRSGACEAREIHAAFHSVRRPIAGRIIMRS
jgi:hypothetical protein